MKKLIVGLLALGLTTQFMISQEIELAEVSLDVNYEYMNAIESNTPSVDLDVINLEEEVAFYKIKESDIYDEEYDGYRVYFYIPKGSIVAAYNEEGKILRTIERFKNIKLPRSIIEAVATRYPDWSIAEDVYKVDYFGKSGNAKKQYKVKVKNDNKTKTLKFDENGEFL